jgi:cell division protein FtsB
MFLFRFHRYDLLVSLGCLALLSSFAWYAFKGPRGYAYGVTLETTMAELTAENWNLAVEKQEMEKRVELLRPEHVDRDLLEEIAKTELGMAYPNELILKSLN